LKSSLLKQKSFLFQAMRPFGYITLPSNTNQA
jgi:hypothetical protein